MRETDTGDPGMTHESGFGLQQLGDGTFRALVEVQIDLDTKKGIALDDVVQHEGGHVADRQSFISSISPLGKPVNSLNITSFESELRAWKASAEVYKIANAPRLAFDHAHVLPSKDFTNPSAVDAMVRDFLLTNPHYNGKNNERLYPTLYEPPAGANNP